MASIVQSIQPGRKLLLLSLLALCGYALPSAQAQPKNYIGIREVARQWGMKTEWLEKDESKRLQSDWVTLDVKAGSRIATLNDIRLFLGQAVVRHRGRLYLSEKDVRYSLASILTPQIFDKPSAAGIIVIDPGHGGKDPGGIHPNIGLREKDIALDVSLRIRDRLQKLGYVVRMTRETDEFLTLLDRAEFARKADADIFLSIHFNTAPPQVRGIETFVLTLPGDLSSSQPSTALPEETIRPGNQYDPWNALLGYYLQRELIRSTQLPDRGLKRSRFAVLELATCPAVLLELGFITNDETAALLQTDAWLDRLADAVVQGVLYYTNTIASLSIPANQSIPNP